MKLIKSNSGFTLIEILIAITILAFIILGIATVSNNSIEAKDRVTKEDNALLEIQTAFNRMEWDFSHIYNPLYFSIKMQNNPFAGEEDIQSEGYGQFMQFYNNHARFLAPTYEALPIPVLKQENKDEIFFFTSANRRKFKNQKQSNFAWVKYKLDDTDEPEEGELRKIYSGTKTLKRVFLADDVFSSEDFDWEKGAKSQVLLENVEKLKFEWWDYKQKKWQDSLRSLTVDKNTLRAIKVTLSIKISEEETIDYFKVFRPLFPYFKSENFYELETVKDDEFLNNQLNDLGGDSFE